MDWFADHIHRLQRLLRRRGRTAEEAQDFVQEAFVRVIDYLSEGGEVREPEKFLVRTVLNVAANAQEREHRDLYVNDPVEELSIAEVGAGPDEALAAEQCLDRLQAVWDTLGSRTQEVFHMHRVEGMSQQQIAQALGISVSAVEKCMARALIALTAAAQEP